MNSFFRNPNFSHNNVPIVPQLEDKHGFEEIQL